MTTQAVTARDSVGRHVHARWTSLVLVVVLAGCAGSGQSGGAGACAATVRWRSITYLGESAARHVPPGRRLGHAVIPACHDTNTDSAADRDMSVEVRAIQGVDPRLAVVVDRDPRVFYVNGQELKSDRVRALVTRFRRRG